MRDQINYKFEFMLVREGIKYSDTWAYSEVEKVYIIQSKPKLLKILHLDQDLEIESQNELIIPFYADQITPHPTHEVFIVSNHKEGAVNLYDFNMKKLLSIANKIPFYKVMFSPNENHMLIVDACRIAVYSFSGESIAQLPPPCENEPSKIHSLFQFNQGGHFFAMCCVQEGMSANKNTVFFYNTKTWTLIHQTKLKKVDHAAGLTWISGAQLVVFNNYLLYQIEKIDFLNSNNAKSLGYCPNISEFGIKRLEAIGDKTLLISQKEFRIVLNKQFLLHCHVELNKLHEARAVRLFQDTTFFEQYKSDKGTTYQRTPLTFQLLKHLFFFKETDSTKNINITYKVSKHSAQFIAFNFSLFKNIILVWNIELKRFEQVVVLESPVNFEWAPEHNILSFSCNMTEVGFLSSERVVEFSIETNELNTNFSGMIGPTAKSVSLAWNAPKRLELYCKSKYPGFLSEFKIVQVSKELAELLIKPRDIPPVKTPKKSYIEQQMNNLRIQEAGQSTCIEITPKN